MPKTNNTTWLIVAVVAVVAYALWYGLYAPKEGFRLSTSSLASFQVVRRNGDGTASAYEVKGTPVKYYGGSVSGAENAAIARAKSVGSTKAIILCLQDNVVDRITGWQVDGITGILSKDYPNSGNPWPGTRDDLLNKIQSNARMLAYLK